MVIVDNIEVTPNPVTAGKTFFVEITLHEEYENEKRYPYKYPHRYGKKEENK